MKKIEMMNPNMLSYIRVQFLAFWGFDNFSGNMNCLFRIQTPSGRRWSSILGWYRGSWSLSSGSHIQIWVSKRIIEWPLPFFIWKTTWLQMEKASLV